MRTEIQRQTIPELRVQFTKRVDGNVVFLCMRRDGSVTWQRHQKQANFYPFHDLAHLAVETILGLRSGFYGLIADGWDIADTTGKGPRGKLPPGSVLVEHIVGLLQIRSLPASEFNAQLTAMIGIDSNRPQFTDEQLACVRSRIEELQNQWASLPAGSTLELSFNRD